VHERSLRALAATHDPPTSAVARSDRQLVPYRCIECSTRVPLTLQNV
jgi:hypothetical protein